MFLCEDSFWRSTRHEKKEIIKDEYVLLFLILSRSSSYTGAKTERTEKRRRRIISDRLSHNSQMDRSGINKNLVVWLLVFHYCHAHRIEICFSTIVYYIRQLTEFTGKKRLFTQFAAPRNRTHIVLDDQLLSFSTLAVVLISAQYSMNRSSRKWCISSSGFIDTLFLCKVIDWILLLERQLRKCSNFSSY